MSPSTLALWAPPSSGSTTTPNTTGTGKSSSISPALLAGLGSVLGASLLGGATPNMPETAPIQAGAQAIGSQGQQVANAGLNLTQAGQTYTPAYLQAVDAYQQQLQMNPYTSSYDVGQEAKAIGGTNQAYDQQQAQTESQLAAQGILQPGGGPNSTATGIAEGFGTAKAGTVAQAQNNLATTAMQQRLNNLGIGANLAGQTQGQLVGEGNQTASTGANIENMSQEELLALQQQIISAQQAGANQSGGIGAALGGLGGLAATGGL